MAQRFLYKDSKHVTIGDTEIPVISEANVIVAGGGIAGLPAAIAAARNNANVTLIEAYPFLGGTATASAMPVIVACDQASGIARELLDRLADAGGAKRWTETPYPSTPFDTEALKRVALEMITESGVKPLFYTTVTGAVMEGNTVKGVVIQNKAGMQAILSDVAIDATGDADLAVSAGAEYTKGREEDSRMRPMVLLFRVGGLDIGRIMGYAREHPDQVQPQYYPREGTVQDVGDEKIVTRISGFYDLVDKAREKGELDPNCYYFRLEACWIERGVATINTGRVYDVDGTIPDHLTRAQILGMRQMYQLLKFMRSHIPGCEKAFIIDSAPKLGVRETRHIVGDYTANEEDALTGKDFHDTIMRLRIGLVTEPAPQGVMTDVHSPDPGEGSIYDAVERNPSLVRRVSHTVNIPYRVLLPKGLENILVAGRCISVSHRIDGSTRNMTHCMRGGQVAGTAAALAVRKGVTPRQLDFPSLGMTLAEQGFTMP